MTSEQENQEISEPNSDEELFENPFFSFFRKLEKKQTASFKGISKKLELIFCIDSDQFEEVLNTNNNN